MVRSAGGGTYSFVGPGAKLWLRLLESTDATEVESIEEQLLQGIGGDFTLPQLNVVRQWLQEWTSNELLAEIQRGWRMRIDDSRGAEDLDLVEEGMQQGFEVYLNCFCDLLEPGSESFTECARRSRRSAQR